MSGAPIVGSERRGAGPLCALLVLGLTTAAAALEALAPEHFATGRAIETRSADPLQTLLLDLPIYRGSVAPGLSDLRVFNAGGEVVPHAIRPLRQPGEAPAETAPVPVFRLPAERSRTGQAASGRAGLARSHGVEVQLSDDGAIVRVEPVGPPGESADAPASSTYLLDLSGLARSAVGLELLLGPEPGEFVLPVRVEASDDLVHFRRLSTRSALARLDQAGHRIERSDVRFAPLGQRYLLLSSQGGPLPVEIRAARAQLAPTTAPPPRQEVRIAGAPVPGEPGAFLFDLGGGVPVDLVQVALPQANTVVRAELLSGASVEGPWTRHFAGLLYRLERTPPLRNGALAVTPRRQRWFKLVVAPQGGGLGGGVPALEASWIPEQLLFVRRGEAPFALGYGRAGAADATFAASELVRTSGVAPDEVPRASASLGAPYPVADASVLSPRSEPTPPRTLALWAFLVVAVAVVLALSVRLLRQMRDPDRGSMTS